MTTSNRRRSKENAQVGDGDHATDEVRNNNVASELRSPQAGSPQGGRNPPKGTGKAQNTKRNNKSPKQLTHMDDARSGPKKNGPNNLERTEDTRSYVIGTALKPPEATVWLGDIELHMMVSAFSFFPVQ